MKKAKKRKVAPQSSDTVAPRPSMARELAGLRIQHGSMCKRYADLLEDYTALDRQHSDLRTRLVNLLSPDQLDAARICAVTPELYALEWIDINREAWLASSPGFASHVKPVREMR